MRRIAKEILRVKKCGNLKGACTLAHCAGYYFEVHVPSPENGLCEPRFFFSRQFPEDELEYDPYVHY